ncbi:MAG: hypothetical protein ACHP7N_04025 [Caulobacterales bacterium]
MTKTPGLRLLYALAAALVWGAACGLIHGPFWGVVVGGVATAALAVWLEWEALSRPVNGRRRPNFPLLLAMSYVFLSLVAVGVVSLGYFAGEWLRHKL